MCKLHRSLYSLKQSPLLSIVTSTLTSTHGALKKQLPTQTSTFIRTTSRSSFWTFMWITCTLQEQTCMRSLASKHILPILKRWPTGALQKFFSIQFVQTKCGILLHQEYVHSLLTEYGMLSTPPTNVPISYSIRFVWNQNPTHQFPLVSEYRGWGNWNWVRYLYL